MWITSQCRTPQRKLFHKTFKTQLKSKSVRPGVSGDIPCAHVLKFYGPGKMACSRGADARTLSQIQSEPGGQDACLWNKRRLKICHHRCDVIKICGFLWEDLTLKTPSWRLCRVCAARLCHPYDQCDFTDHKAITRWLPRCHKHSQSRMPLVVKSLRPS